MNFKEFVKQCRKIQEIVSNCKNLSVLEVSGVFWPYYITTNNFTFELYAEYSFPDTFPGGWVAGWVEIGIIKTISAHSWARLPTGLSLAKKDFFPNSPPFFVLISLHLKLQGGGCPLPPPPHEIRPCLLEKCIKKYRLGRMIKVAI